MPEPLEFNRLTRLTAQSLGEAGRRSFYLIASQDARWVRAWLDRDQLEALGTALQQVLATLEGRLFLDPEPKEPPSGVDRDPDPEEPPEAELHTGRIAVSYDPQRDLMALILSDREEADQRAMSFSGRATREQMQGLICRIAEIMAAGRPRCPLCGGPLDPEAEHLCVRANGHGPSALS